MSIDNDGKYCPNHHFDEAEWESMSAQITRDVSASKNCWLILVNIPIGKSDKYFTGEQNILIQNILFKNVRMKRF